jgi:hypothetical protein
VNAQYDNLPLEEIVTECKKVATPNASGFLYFLNTYVFIEDKEAKTAMKLNLWPSQTEIIPTIVLSQLIVMLKARQLGLTWLIAAYVLWRSIIHQLHLSVIISVTESLSIEFLDRVYFIHERLPIWISPPVKTHTQQVCEFAHVGGLTSTIKSLPTTEMGAQSKTPNILVLDETCKNRMVQSIFNASYPGVEQAKGQVIVISNSIKEGAGWAWTRDLYIGAMRKLNDFKRIFLSWTAHPGRQETFKADMLRAGMKQRDIDEHYPETEEDAISDRNIIGVYYSQQMATARKDKRVTVVPWSPGYEVYTFWDLGVDDSTAIWFMQQIGLQFRFIDYYENVGMGMVHYAKVLKDKPYAYGDHYMPHDVEKRSLQGDTDVALTLKETAENLGIEPIVTVAKAKDTQAILNAIEAGRNILHQCVFDEEKCAEGIRCLESYRSEWDDDRQTLGNKPLHNWAAHGCLSGDTLVATDTGDIPIKDVQIGQRVRTPYGYRLVLNAGVVQQNADVLDITLSNGTIITATGNHKFFTHRGLVYSDDLRHTDYVVTKTMWRSLVWNIQMLLCLKAVSTGYRETIIEGVVGGKNNDDYMVVVRRCIEQFGNTIMARLNKGMKYTIRMVMDSTMILPIWNHALCRSINETTLSIDINREHYIHRENWHYSEQQSGTIPPKGYCGTASTLKKHGRRGSNILFSVYGVGKYLLHLIKTKLNIAQLPVKLSIGIIIRKIWWKELVLFAVNRILSIKRLLAGHAPRVVHVKKGQSQPVYDLTVDKDHCYFANNVLVSNSDAFRTFSQGYQALIPDPDEELKRKYRGYMGDRGLSYLGG